MAPPSRPAGKRVTRFSGRFAPLRIVFPCHRGIGRATKGKRLYGQARRLSSPDLHILCRMCTVDNKAPQSNPFTQRIAKNKVPPPGGRWWRQPPKGVHFHARRAVVWFYNTGAFYKLKGAHHGLCPLSGANTTLGTEGRQARWMPYAPLRRRRRPLREYRKAPPHRLVFIER